MKKTRKSKAEVQKAARAPVVRHGKESEPHKIRTPGEPEPHAAGEKCQRCGEVGEDRRTLHMACFYAMEEMGLPFEQVRVQGERFPFAGMKEIRPAHDNFPPLTVPEYAEQANGKVDAAYYLLRVCKACRSEWMAAIKSWFFTPPTVREGCGTGIFVRELGACREITLEEWERRRAESQKDDPHMPKPNVED